MIVVLVALVVLVIGRANGGDNGCVGDADGSGVSAGVHPLGAGCTCMTVPGLVHSPILVVVSSEAGSTIRI